MCRQTRKAVAKQRIVEQGADEPAVREDAQAHPARQFLFDCCLQTTFNRYPVEHNTKPMPFFRQDSAASILAKLGRPPAFPE